MTIDKTTCVLVAIILSMGLLDAGYQLGHQYYQAKTYNRIVTVKGLAEQDVVADLGIWEINYREVGNDLVDLDKRLLSDHTTVVQFLKQQGFDEAEIARGQFKIEDRLANIYQQTNSQNVNEPRYVVTGGTRVRSSKVVSIQKSAQIIDQLIQQGLLLAFDVSQVAPNPSYYYTQLDSIRPEMLAKATKSARSVALQFAKDADVHLTSIQRASQGQFQIMSRDTSTMSADWNSNESAMGTINKKVRLVTTIDYGIAR